MIGYKVVMDRYGIPSSCNVNLSLKSALCLTYKDEEVVIAPNGTMGIFIFRDKCAAFRFILDTLGTYLWYVKQVEILSRVTNREYFPISFDFFRCLKEGNFSLYRYKQMLKQSKFFKTPPGTYTCRKLRVIGKVER
jgi:hypothetical protein